MIDSLHIRLNKNDVGLQQLKNLPEKIILNKQVLRTSTQLTTYIGNFKNFQVSVNSKNICLNGSLSNFLFGHNIFTLSHSQVKTAITELSKALDLPLYRGKIARIDIADTIPVDQPIIHYLISLLETPGYERFRSERKSDSVRYEKDNVHLVFYNKSGYAIKHPDAWIKFGHKPLLRIELRIKNNVRRTIFNSIKNLRVLNLYSPTFLNLLCTAWVTHYNTIIKSKKLNTVTNIGGWGSFQDFMTAAAIQEKGIIYWHDYINYTAKHNAWQQRTIRNVKSKVDAILGNEKFSIYTDPIKELNSKIINTKLYSFYHNNE